MPRKNTSEVNLVLKKDGILSVSKRVKARKVYPNLYKLAYENIEINDSVFYKLLIKHIKDLNINTIICSNNFKKNLSKLNLVHDIDYIIIDNEDFAVLSKEVDQDFLKEKLSNSENKNIFICALDYFVRESIVSILKDKKIFFTNIIDVVNENANFLNSENFFPIDKNIYPIRIPEINVSDNCDVLLIDCPSRNLSLMPNGLGYVYNTLKKCNFNLEILDLDIITYHRYHLRRIFDQGGVIEINDETFPEDPWRAENYDIWSEKGEFSILEKQNIDQIYEANSILKFLKPIIDETINQFKKTNPKIVGFSIQQCNIPFTKILVKEFKKINPNIIVIVGGFSCYNADIGLQAFPDADYMCIGESDLTAGPLFEKVFEGKRPFNQPGILSKFDTENYKDNFVQAPMIHDLDRIEPPKYEWIDLSVYRNFNDYQLVPIIASRGCRWSRCTFCAERFYWRIRSAKNFVDELEWLIDQGTHLYMFNESDLNGMPERVLEICDEIIKRGLHKKVILTGQLRIHKKSTKEFFQKLHKAGFRALRFGVDAFSKNTLKLQQKGYTVDMIEQNLKDCHEAGIRTEVNWVIGVPGETDEDVEEGINLILRNKNYIGRLANINPLILANGSVYWIDPDSHNIKFNGDKEKLFRDNPKALPADKWYSEKPYIDANVRQKRFEHIVYSLYQKGFPLGDWAEKIVEAVISGTDEARTAKQTDEYNYSPETKIEKVYELKFIQIYKMQKIYNIKEIYISFPSNFNVRNYKINDYLSDKNFHKSKNLQELKGMIDKSIEFADTRGQYTGDKDRKKDIYRVDSLTDSYENRHIVENKNFGTFYVFQKELFLTENVIEQNNFKINYVINLNNQPELISNFNGLNIVRYEETYFALPQGLRLNWVKNEDLKDVHILKSKNLNDLFKLVEGGGEKSINKFKSYANLFLININYFLWRIVNVIHTRGIKYFLIRSLFLLKQKTLYSLRNITERAKLLFKKRVSSDTKVVEIEKDFTNQNESNFIKKLYNYKIYKYDDTFYGFPKSKKANFEEEDYYLDDAILKDKSIDAVETQIIELQN